MSVAVMGIAWKCDVSSTDKIVLLALADWSNDDGHCWPSIKQLMTKCSLSERAIQGSIKRLSSAGHIEQDIRAGKGAYYTIHPRTTCTPADTAPPQQVRETPARRADNTSGKHHTSEAKASSVKRAREAKHSLPANWEPIAFAEGSVCRKIIDGWPPGELEHQLEHFRAHHTKKGDQFASWQDAWKTWVLNSRNFGGRNGKSEPSGRGKTGIAADRIRERLAAHVGRAAAGSYG